MEKYPSKPTLSRILNAIDGDSADKAIAEIMRNYTGKLENKPLNAYYNGVGHCLPKSRIYNNKIEIKQTHSGTSPNSKPCIELFETKCSSKNLQPDLRKSQCEAA